VTVLEINDICATLTDIDDLRDLASPGSADSVERAKVCAIEIPTAEELLLAVKNAPKAAWQAAKEYTPSLQDMKDVDWSAYGASLTTTFSSAGSWTGNAISGTFDATKEGAAGVWEWMTGDDEEAGEGTE
ncbi:unnamed protein product, partial [Ectocarpus sp. 12 AP-2014]